MVIFRSVSSDLKDLIQNNNMVATDNKTTTKDLKIDDNFYISE